MPTDVPLGTKIRHIATENVPLPHKHFSTTSNTLTAWMSSWIHVGPRVQAATLFVSVSPALRRKPVAVIDMLEPLEIVETESSEYSYSADGIMRDWTVWLSKGLVAGLQTVLSHPLADVNIRVSNVIVHKIDSSPKAFEMLGQWLVETMTTEMYKRDWIKVV
jgi:hypothetical protein